MNNEKLAILGGSKTITTNFKNYNSIGEEEVEAAKSVIESGILSQYIGSFGPDFFGGPKVKEFERECEIYFDVKHAITVNSWTSGLIAAIGAIGIEPGDEVIVSTWTMCASATAILQWNAIPVFADIDPETFCISIASIEENITPYTKAIMVVDIFGQSADIDAIMDLAKKHNLKVICDTAQSPGALYKNKYAGTLADIGGFSLNYHKHIHTGEGGVLVTNDDDLAEKMQLIRNHAEAVVGDKGMDNIANMIGFNFRLGEIECAIGLEQLKKLDNLVKGRQRAAARLTSGLANLSGLTTPRISENCTHVYYVYGIVLNIPQLGVDRDTIIEALHAEGVTGVAGGYVNVHLLPMYQKKIAFGSNGFPWNSDICKRDVSYEKGICPVAEEFNDRSFLSFAMCLHDLSDAEVDLIIEAFKKVWKNLDRLR